MMKKVVAVVLTGGVSVVFLVCSTLGAAASARITPGEMAELQGGCNAYCLETMQCGTAKPCTSSQPGAGVYCDPTADPDDCSGAAQNKCEPTTEHNACNSTNSQNDMCEKGERVHCGKAKRCYCKKMATSWQCYPNDEHTTCGYYNPASPPCYEEP